MRTMMIAGSLDGVKSEVFKKSLSNDNKTLCFSHAKKYRLEFLIPFGANTISMPLFERDLTSLASTSSSAKNLGFDVNKSFTGQSFRCVMKGSFDVLFGQGGVGFDDFLVRGSPFKHLQHLPYHHSCTFESGLAMTDIAICNNVFVDNRSHEDKAGRRSI